MNRVMIVTNSLTGGGAERSMNLISNELTKRGWSVALVPINSGDQDQVRPTCDVFPLHRKWQGGLYDTIRAVWKFNLTVRSWKPEIIILNCDLPELFGATLVRPAKLIIVEHTSMPWANRENFGKLIRKLLSLRSATWIAVSDHLRIWPAGSIPNGVIQNPLIPNTFSIIPESLTILLRLIFIGRLSIEKRPRILLEIAEKFDIKVEVIGEGSLRSEMETDVQSKGLRVSFHGQQPQPWNLVKSGDLLIVPSAYEGDGLVVIEAIQNKIPLLVADIPDFRRFGFPEQNYCASTAQYIERIKAFQNKLSELIISPDFSEPLLASRSIQTVGDKWEDILIRKIRIPPKTLG